MKNIRLHIQALGLVMVLFGSPIIHFFRDFLTIIPKSPLVMPAFSFVFFAMMLSARHFTKLYKPNYNMAVTGAIFLAYAIFLAFISPHPLKLGTELSNYIFLAVFFYLLCGLSYKISYVIMPIIVKIGLKFLQTLT